MSECLQVTIAPLSYHSNTTLNTPNENQNTQREIVIHTNDIVSQLSDCSSSSDEKLCIGPERLSLLSRKSWTPLHEWKREMEKGKSDVALTQIFDDPSVPLCSIGSTSTSCAGTARVEHSSAIFRHDAPVNVRVFLNESRYTIPQNTPCVNQDHLLDGRKVVRNRYQVVTI